MVQDMLLSWKPQPGEMPEDHVKLVVEQALTPSTEVIKDRSNAVKFVNPLSFRLGEKNLKMETDHFHDVETSVYGKVTALGLGFYLDQLRDKNRVPFFGDESSCTIAEAAVKEMGVLANKSIQDKAKVQALFENACRICTHVVEVFVDPTANAYSEVFKVVRTASQHDKLLALLEAIKLQRDILENPDVATAKKEAILKLAKEAPVPKRLAVQRWVTRLQNEEMLYEQLRTHKEPLDYWRIERAIVSSISIKEGQHNSLKYMASADLLHIPADPTRATETFTRERFFALCALWCKRDADENDWQFQTQKQDGTRGHAGGSVPNQDEPKGSGKTLQQGTPRDSTQSGHGCFGCGGSDHKLSGCKVQKGVSLSKKELAAGLKLRTEAKAYVKNQEWLAGIESKLAELMKKATNKAPGKTTETPPAASSSSQGNPSTTVNGGKFGTRFDVLNFVDADGQPQDPALEDDDSEWDSDSDGCCGVDFPDEDGEVRPMPAAAVSYFSALAGKAKSFAGAVSRAAAAPWAGPPKPAKYAVHPDTPVERQYDKHDRQKIKGKLKDENKKAYAVMHLLQTIQAVHFPASASSYKQCSAVVTRAAARQAQPAGGDADGEAPASESGESI
jgi:predicted DCC family thiol-disulfide oxidoreductase YuxK